MAHVLRPCALARALDPVEFDVTLCRPLELQWLTADSRFRVVDLHCQGGAVFSRRLEYGLPLYDFKTLVRYVEEDLALIDELRPEVIVGDFRLSLSVSARLRSIPYVTICDAYWSPERTLSPPLPAFFYTRIIPLPLARLMSRALCAPIIRLHTVPLEWLRAPWLAVSGA